MIEYVYMSVVRLVVSLDLGAFQLLFWLLLLVIALHYPFSCLLLVDIGTLIISLVAAVVVPASLPSIIIVPENECIHSRWIALGILYCGHSMELFPNRPLHNHILLILQVLGLGIEVEFVVIGIWNHYFSLVHVNWNWQYPLQSKVWILYVSPVDLLVLIE